VRVARYAYDPYGRCTVLGATDPIAHRNPLRYRAYYLDAETGMHCLPARYYDPATYRFLSPDPAPPSAADPLSLNAYAYCLGDPVGLTDPSGAVVDVDCDGRLDVEDSVQQNATNNPTPENRAAARMATGAAESGRSAAEIAAAVAAFRRSWAALACHDTSPYGKCNDINVYSYPTPEALWSTVVGGALDLANIGSGLIKVKPGEQLMAQSRSAGLLAIGIAYDGYVFESVDEAWEAGYVTKLDRDMSHAAVIPGVSIGMVYMYAWGEMLGYDFAQPR